MRPPAPDLLELHFAFLLLELCGLTARYRGTARLKTSDHKASTIIVDHAKSKLQSLTVHNASKQEIHVWLRLTTDST
jgi:hypothetical protein